MMQIRSTLPNRVLTTTWWSVLVHLALHHVPVYDQVRAGVTWTDSGVDLADMTFDPQLAKDWEKFLAD